FEDKGGFWVRVDYWKNNAEQLNRLLAKGMQVQVSGELRLDEWPDSDNPGQNLSGMALTAESIAILPARVQTITMQERQAQQHMSPISAYQEMDQYDDDVPM
ncbi:single-stranded DNA-binding protein, partial [Photobacterium leiognathi]